MGWIYLVAVLLVACTPDLDRATAVREEILPLMPDVPGDQLRCAECALEKCSEELSACKKDDGRGGCEELRYRNVGCRDPKCLLINEPAKDSKSYQIYDRYRNCVFKYKCASACQSGNNWNCRGNYNWDDLGEGDVVDVTFTVKVHQITALLTKMIDPGESGVSVSVSGTMKTTNGFGEVEFNVSKGTLLPIIVARGKADLPSPERIGPLHYYIDRNGIDITSADHRIILYVPKRANESEEGVANQKKGSLSAMVYDCLSQPAINISYQLTDRPGKKLDIDAQYWDNDQEMQSRPGKELVTIGGFFNLDLSSYKIEAFTRGVEEPVARTEVMTLENKESSVFAIVYPIIE